MKITAVGYEQSNGVILYSLRFELISSDYACLIKSPPETIYITRNEQSFFSKSLFRSEHTTDRILYKISGDVIIKDIFGNTIIDEELYSNL
jgi:hypothetical protein